MMFGQLNGPTPQITAAEDEYERRLAEFEAAKIALATASPSCGQVWPKKSTRIACSALRDRVSATKTLKNKAFNKLKSLQSAYGTALKKQQKQEILAPEAPLPPMMPMARAGPSPLLLAGGALALVVGVMVLRRRK